MVLAHLHRKFFLNLESGTIGRSFAPFATLRNDYLSELCRRSAIRTGMAESPYFGHTSPRQSLVRPTSEADSTKNAKSR